MRVVPDGKAVLISEQLHGAFTPYLCPRLTFDSDDNIIFPYDNGLYEEAS